MSKHICIHAHFYQPPRENPWLEEVEMQDSAYPYHDWNQRITLESYAPNTSARILDDDKKIINIVNNYEKISFNFGPTLLSWMERNEKDTYEAIIKADELSKNNFSGHGSALSQCYNHMIMPLSTSRDKETQIVWGIKDFENRFKRSPEGMWLPETAVDKESLEIMADKGIKFTILAPRQAKCIRKMGEGHWHSVKDNSINTQRPYLCKLDSGKTISIFFYNGQTSRDIAFGELLASGQNFANRLLSLADDHGNKFVNIATDGETYGHHHLKGDMALAFCINYIDLCENANLTNYGEYLERHPPEFEVEVYNNSSWSCVHGVERWRDNCGCNSGLNQGWSQAWRSPLRKSLDWLRDELIKVYKDNASEYLIDPRESRNDYISVILDRSEDGVNNFLSKHSVRSLSQPEKVKVLKLLEMQRHAMLMYTSCGWFFDEVSGIETKQILQYASRAIQLAEDITQNDYEKTFISMLEKAPSNIRKYKDAAYVYEKYVKPTMLDLVRVGAHYAVSSLFEEYSEITQIYSYTAHSQYYDKLENGKQKLAIGKALIRSNITLEEKIISYAVLHLGDHNLTAGVREYYDEKIFVRMCQETRDIFKNNDITGTIRFIEKHFDTGHYSLWHLFKDEQSKILYQILDSTLEEVEQSLRQINEYHYPIIQVIKQLHIPLPKVLSNTVLVMINADLLQVLGNEKIDFNKLEDLVGEVQEWSLEIDKITLSFIVRHKIDSIMKKMLQRPLKIQLLQTAESLLRILKPLALDIDFWKAQNIYFSIGKNYYEKMKIRQQKGNLNASTWVNNFNLLGEYLEVRIVN